MTQQKKLVTLLLTSTFIYFVNLSWLVSKSTVYHEELLKRRFEAKTIISVQTDTPENAYHMTTDDHWCARADVNRKQRTGCWKEFFLKFCTLSLKIRIFTIIHDVLQHYYVKWCETRAHCWRHCYNRGKRVHCENLSKNTINAHFKRQETHQIVMVFPHVPKLSHKCKHPHITSENSSFSYFRKQIQFRFVLLEH